MRINRVPAKAVVGYSNDLVNDEDPYQMSINRNLISKERLEILIKAYVDIILERGICNVDEFLEKLEILIDDYEF